MTYMVKRNDQVQMENDRLPYDCHHPKDPDLTRYSMIPVRQSTVRHLEQMRYCRQTNLNQQKVFLKNN